MVAATFETLICKVVGALSGGKTTFDEGLQHVVDILAGYFGVEKCSVMVINQGAMTLEVRAATNSDIIGMQRQLCDVTVATMSLLEDAPLSSNKEDLSCFLPMDSTRYTSSNSLSVPIKHYEKKVGVLNLTDKKNNRPLTAKQVKEAVKITDSIAVYLYASQANDLLEKKVITCEDALAQVKKADDMKTSLTSFIVHDLKGPISTIMANLDMLSYEPLTAEQLGLANLALNDVHKMQRMVMNILDVQKMEEGKINIYREETDICELAQREIMSFKSLLAMRGMSAVLDGEPRLLFIDENLIGRTISNLLNNAVEHSPDDKQVTVEIHYDADRKETAVSVADEGAGIPDQFKKQVFEKFFQIEAGKMYRKTTTGLGLTFCKLVVEAHGGRLWIEDNEGGGTRFIFTLPETIKEAMG